MHNTVVRRAMLLYSLETMTLKRQEAELEVAELNTGLLPQN